MNKVSQHIKVKEYLKNNSKDDDISKLFLNIINGCEIVFKKQHPDSIFYVKNNEIIMQYYTTNNILTISYDKIFKVFSKFSQNYFLIEKLIQNMVDKFLNYKNATIICGNASVWKRILNN